MNFATFRVKSFQRISGNFLCSSHKKKWQTESHNIAVSKAKVGNVHVFSVCSACIASPAHSASHTVISVKLWLDVTDVTQQLAQHRLPVSTVTCLDATHSLGRVAVHLHSTVAMGTESLGAGSQRYELHEDIAGDKLKKLAQEKFEQITAL